MLKTKLGELSLESLMLARLTGVVDLRQDALSTGNAGGEMTSAVTAVNVAKKISASFTYNSEIWEGHADLGHLKLAIFLS